MNMEALAKAAAKWWADTLRVPPQHDNGAEDQTASRLARILASGRRPHPDQVDKFEAKLREFILREIATGRRYIDVATDYGPQGILLYAADAADDSGKDYIEAYLPWKTNMVINTDNNTIEVSAGYGAPWTMIPPIEKVETQ